MNIETLIRNMKAYGTPEGVKLAWESRPRALGRPRPQLLESRYLSLELRNSPLPHVFENSDKTSWHWSSDKSNLVVETVEEPNTEDRPNALGMEIKTTYTIPVRNITYWGPEQESPIYLKRKGMEPSSQYKTGFMMGMKGKKRVN
jgi:hypothetical protein